MREDHTEQVQLPEPRRRVMAVDDDAIQLALMGETFAALGYEFQLFESALPAWEALTQSRFDLAVIDLNMPQVDGFELLRRIRRHPACANLPVIVATANGDKDSIDKAYQLGASSFATKPINWAQFSHHVRFMMRNGQVERELRLAKAEAATAARLKNGLFKVLGHELKTPLTALIGLTEVLSQSLGARLQSADAENLGLVAEAAQRLNRMTGDILLLSRAMAGPSQLDRTRVSTHDLLEEALAGFHARAARLDLKLTFAEPRTAIDLDCDAGLLVQALRRLIDNALKFSPAGGDIALWAERGQDGRVALSVRDRGPGLTMARLRECLQPFVQGDMSYARPVEGLGLGLPIAHAIAEAHGGELSVTTEPGQGLTACLSLPAQQPNATAA